MKSAGTTSGASEGTQQRGSAIKLPHDHIGWLVDRSH